MYRGFVKCEMKNSSWLFQYTQSCVMSLMTWMIWVALFSESLSSVWHVPR